MQLTKEELARYSRHLILPGFGLEAQEKLKAAKVLVVGSGGLGSPLLLYLAAAGVGTLGIVEFDSVDVSNLQRQVPFTQQDQGESKALAAQKRLQALNPHIRVVAHETQLTAGNAMEILAEYDVVADGTDNFPTRYLVNDACVLLNKVLIYGSIYRYEGQVSVFHHVQADGSRSPNYRDLFPEPPPPNSVPSCAEGGVLGVLPGMIGSMQANEVIKVITGVGEPLAGKLFLLDAATLLTRTISFKRNPKNPLNGEQPSQTELIDYQDFCGLKEEVSAEKEIPEITVQELRDWQQNGADFTLIDVREPYEYSIANLGGMLIPQGELDQQLDRIPREGRVILHCRSGQRSAKALGMLRDQHGYTNLINLQGGILAYAEEIDPTLAKY